MNFSRGLAGGFVGAAFFRWLGWWAVFPLAGIAAIVSVVQNEIRYFLRFWR